MIVLDKTAHGCRLCTSVFLLYDFTITFGREVDLFWTRRFTGATVLFLANKYLTLSNHIFDITLYIPVHVSDKVSCFFSEIIIELMYTDQTCVSYPHLGYQSIHDARF